VNNKPSADQRTPTEAVFRESMFSPSLAGVRDLVMAEPRGVALRALLVENSNKN